MFFFDYILIQHEYKDKKITFKSNKLQKEFVSLTGKIECYPVIKEEPYYVSHYQSQINRIAGPYFANKIRIHDINYQLHEKQGPAFDCGEVEIVKENIRIIPGMMSVSKSSFYFLYSKKRGAFRLPIHGEIEDKEFFQKDHIYSGFII